MIKKENRLSDTPEPFSESPMDHPAEQPTGTEAPFKLVRLLAVLTGAIVLVALIAVAAASLFA